MASVIPRLSLLHADEDAEERGEGGSAARSPGWIFGGAGAGAGGGGVPGDGVDEMLLRRGEGGGVGGDGGRGGYPADAQVRDAEEELM